MSFQRSIDKRKDADYKIGRDLVALTCYFSQFDRENK